MNWLALVLSLLVPTVPVLADPPIRIDIPEHCSQALHRDAIELERHPASWETVETILTRLVDLSMGMWRIDYYDGLQPCAITTERYPWGDVVIPSRVIVAALKIPREQRLPRLHDMAHVFWTHNCATVALPDDVTVELCHAP